MPTPNVYYSLNERYEYLRAIAFRYMMSPECPSVTTPNAAALFDLVGDMTGNEAAETIRAWREDN